MPKFYLLGAFLLLRASVATAQIAPLNEWENPQAVARYKEPAIVGFILSGNVADVDAAGYGRSPYYASFNGPWNFCYVLRPAERMTNLFQPGFNNASWQPIKVPGNWEMPGFGTPVYNSCLYLFSKNQPCIGALDNLAGTCLRSFAVPAGWDGREILRHFGAVSDDGRTMSEAGARRNLKLMRQFNLNAVRASHYSNDERLYKLGFYLVDGAEPRGGFDKGGSPACRPEGKAGIRDLITRLVARDKSPATTTSEAWAMRMATAQCATRLALG